MERPRFLESLGHNLSEERNIPVAKANLTVQIWIDDRFEGNGLTQPCHESRET